MPEYLEIDPSLPNIRTTKDILRVVHDKDEMYKNYYQISVAVIILVFLVIIGIVLLVDKNGKDDIITVLHVKGMSFSLGIVAILVFVVPWINTFAIRKIAISKWKTKNKLD
jgi:uncharacterized Tic20 family protein